MLGENKGCWLGSEEGKILAMRERVAGIVIIFGLLLSLAGCGGGGGEDSPANRPPVADAGDD